MNNKNLRRTLLLRSNPQRGFAPIFILAVVAILGIAGYSFWTKVGGIEGLQGNRPTPTPTPKPGCRYEEVVCVKAPCPPVLMCDNEGDKIDETANWKSYENTIWGYTLKHPQGWAEVEQVDNEGNETTKITGGSEVNAQIGQRTLPEVHVGLQSPYGNTPCGDTKCEKAYTLTVNILNKPLAIDIYSMDQSYTFETLIPNKIITLQNSTERRALHIAGTYNKSDEEIIKAILASLVY